MAHTVEYCREGALLHTPHDLPYKITSMPANRLSACSHGPRLINYQPYPLLGGGVWGGGGLTPSPSSMAALPPGLGLSIIYLRW